MKAKILTKVLLMVVVCSAIFSCVNDDDFDIPKTMGTNENQGLKQLLDSINKKDNGYTIVTYQNLKQRYDIDKKAYKVETNDVIKGYVTTSDVSGNFYKEFFMQDAPSSPTSGIRVAIDQTDTYNQFNVGREVYIHLNGLYVGESRSGDGVISIGGTSNEDGEIETLSENQIKSSVFRSVKTEKLEPVVLSPSAISASNIGQLIKIENVNFPENIQGLTYVSPSDKYDTQRPIEFCRGFDKGKFPLETSSFSNFKNEVLPKGSGSIKGVVSKTFNGSSLVLVLNTTADVVFDATKSECAPLDIEDYKTILDENFDSVKNKSDINLAGWINFKEAGKFTWRGGVYKGNGYAEFSAYKSGEDSNVCWLITPAIDLDATTGEFLTFDTAYAFPVENHEPLEVLVSTDFNGNPTGISSATWEKIDANLASAANAEWYQFVNSGFIDLSNYKGKLYVAYKYTGSGNDELTTTMRLENLKVLAQK